MEYLVFTVMVQQLMRQNYNRQPTLQLSLLKMPQSTLQQTYLMNLISIFPNTNNISIELLIKYAGIQGRQNQAVSIRAGMLNYRKLRFLHVCVKMIVESPRDEKAWKITIKHIDTVHSVFLLTDQNLQINQSGQTKI